MARFMGSGGIIAAARSAYLTASIDNQLMMLPVKNNLAPRENASGLTYEIRSAVVADGITTSLVEWTGETELWANEALAKEAAKNRAPKLLAAKEFLVDLLTDGPKREIDIMAEGNSQGHAERTLKRARIELGYLSKKDGFSGGWKWYTPDQWANCEEVQDRQKEKPFGLLREDKNNQKKVANPQAQEFGLLRGKSTPKTGLKPTGSKGFTEEGQVPEKISESATEENTPKLPENAKKAKCSVLGATVEKVVNADSWGAV
jgi:hypothetical protein